MKRLVLLQAPLGHIDRVTVRPGHGSIERATGLRPDQAARLDPDDLFAIQKAMLK